MTPQLYHTIMTFLDKMNQTEQNMEMEMEMETVFIKFMVYLRDNIDTLRVECDYRMADFIHGIMEDVTIRQDEALASAMRHFEIEKTLMAFVESKPYEDLEYIVPEYGDSFPENIRPIPYVDEYKYMNTYWAYIFQKKTKGSHTISNIKTYNDFIQFCKLLGC